MVACVLAAAGVVASGLVWYRVARAACPCFAQVATSEDAELAVDRRVTVFLLAQAVALESPMNGLEAQMDQVQAVVVGLGPGLDLESLASVISPLRLSRVANTCYTINIAEPRHKAQPGNQSWQHHARCPHTL